MKTGSAATASKAAGKKASTGTHERKAAEKEHFGPSRAKVEYDPDYTPEQRRALDRRIEEVFGRQLTVGEIASLVGAPHDAHVSIRAGWGGTKSFEISVRSGEMSADRTITRTSKGVVIHNDFIEVYKKRTGLGTKILGRQVEQAVKLGIKRIDITAGKGVTMVGYYSWARMGYNAPIPARVKSQLPSGMKKAKTVNDLMKTEKGRRFWETHGVQTQMTFDLTAGSLSRRTLAAYVKATGR